MKRVVYANENTVTVDQLFTDRAGDWLLGVELDSGQRGVVVRCHASSVFTIHGLNMRKPCGVAKFTPFFHNAHELLKHLTDLDHSLYSFGTAKALWTWALEKI